MKSSFVPRVGLSGLMLMATAALFLLTLGAPNAGAATTVSGNATFTVKNGTAAKALKKGKAKASAVAPAKAKGKQISAPVSTLSVGTSSKAGLKGGIRFKAGKRKVTISGLNLTISPGKTVVKGKVGGRQVTVFNAASKAVTDTQAGTVKIGSAKLSLSAPAAKAIRKGLKLKKLPAGQIGTFSFTGKVTTDTPPVDPCIADPNGPTCPPQPIVDPYFAQCNVAATSKVNGNLPAAAALPTLSNPVPTTGSNPLSWGVKASFRNYIVNMSGGSLHVLDGATADGAGPVFTGFNFPSTGQYSDNGTPDPSDDKAIYEGSGTVVFCATGHNFRVTISNPTVVIDGDNSRIIADVDSNLSGIWVPTQRVDFADLTLAGVTQTQDGAGSKLTWDKVKTSLTSSGQATICGTDNPQCIYAEGEALDPITVSTGSDLVFDAVDPYLAQCTVGSANTPATGKVWGGLKAAGALPTLADPIATTEPTGLNWGFKQSFRGYVFGAGKLEALAPATRAPGGDPTRGFVFPTSGGQYAANSAASTADDQALINGTGSAAFCNPAHGFRVVISNPTVVIDGDNSRIVADLDMNLSGNWYPTQRVDLADLDLTGITPIYNKSGSEVTWGSVPATLGGALGGLIGGYPAGEALDPVTVSIKTPYDNSDMTALANYVSTKLPFPKSDPTLGGCNLPVPAGGSASLARTIDENNSFGGTGNIWTTNGARPAAQPDLSAGTAVTGGGLDWGLRSGLRSTTNAGGRFNLAGGATASTDYFGYGGGFASPPGTYGTGLGAAAAFFTWPAATSAGFYDAGTSAADDDRLVLKTAGTVALCNDAMSPGAMLYGTVLSDPTVIIDGANSRITVDVTTRYRLSWVRATVDVASIDLTGVTPTGTTTKTWAATTAGAVKMTAAGASVLRMLGTAYVEGAALDAVTVRAQI